MSVAPEAGQLAWVRNRLWLVRDALPQEGGDGSVLTRVELECLDDDRLGQETSLLWEREVNARVLDGGGFPKPSGKWDHPDTFQAFLTAVRWSSTSVLSGPALQSPFRGGIELEPYQLEPAARAVTMPRVNLLIADDVGLGKTVEAGLVLQELLGRARVRNCLIVCPASLQRQWQEEMEEKFNLSFHVIDRDAVIRLRREYGVHVNPWASFPRLITSMDFLKRDAVQNQFLGSLQPGAATGTARGRRLGASWDLLILDEAHNCAPAGRQKYIRDTDRTRMLRQIAPHFQHRLFLTATPHNGFTESFTALLAELDPLRFHRGPEVDPVEIQTVMVRRLKEELAEAEETVRSFPRRRVLALSVPEDGPEQRASDLLDRYVRSRVGRASDAREKLPVQFALTLLRKRFLSSPLAFQRSLLTHLDHVTRPGAAPEKAQPERRDAALAEQLILLAREEQADDDARDQVEEAALRESTRFFGELTPEEDSWLAELWAWADARLLAVGTLGQKLHEELATLAWNILPGVEGLAPAFGETLSLLPEDAFHPPIPAALGARLQGLVERSEEGLKVELSTLASVERARVEAELHQRAEHEVAQVREMIRKRIDEIRKRLREMEKADTRQLAFDFGEEEQFRDDEKRLRYRLDQLAQERQEQPERIRERYRLRDLRVFPLGLRFVLPKSAVERGAL